ncbi:MAG: hypothetical protein RI556_12250 [Hydrogenovibrio sp.]|uniref:hypothetical protein n=1 Tax=Hydrogenovibrio sp. TaxID=2065821 RepID=UPI00287081B2|nr:hypothetical protein [Hydrogenovibrio sp.]MDR9499940.1 hypothetical protein [Hydrogenovibrio sp.]
MLRQLDQKHDDWLVCMISSQLHQIHSELDWIVSPSNPEFDATGLKVASVFRLSRLAVLDGDLLLGQLGSITDQRLKTLQQDLSHWLVS